MNHITYPLSILALTLLATFAAAGGCCWHGFIKNGEAA